MMTKIFIFVKLNLIRMIAPRIAQDLVRKFVLLMQYCKRVEFWLSVVMVVVVAFRFVHMTISAITYVRDVTATAELLERDDVDAIEIHTSGREPAVFKQLWTGLGSSIANLKLVAVSFPDLRGSTISAMKAMYSVMEANIRCFNLWQLDGRPMSGDIGRGATRDAIAFARKLASAADKPKGFLQLAGGTNAHTAEGLKKERLFQTTSIDGASKYETTPSSTLRSPNALIGGVAFGGYARKIVGRVLNSLQGHHGLAHVEDFPEELLQAIIESVALVGTVKCYNMQKQII